MNIRGAGVPCVISGSGGGGSAQINWEGAWDSATAYQVDDIVEYNGSSYIAIQASTNEIPSPTSAFWDLVAEKGATGDAGAPGAPGAPGADGDGTAYYGQMSNQSSQTVTIATAGTYVEMDITGTFDTANSYGLIAPSTASFGIKNDSGSTQLLHFIATADVGAANNEVAGLRLALNGTPLSETTCQAGTGVGGASFAKVMTQWMIEVDDGDEVSMWLTNVTAANPLTVYRAKIVAITPGRQGEEGDPGAAATIAIGTVTTGAPGSSASVTNSGTSSAAVFDFSIPEGDKGDQGDPGTAATIAIGTVTTGAPGSSATVTNVGTSSVAVFDFSIPEGDVGATGATGSIGPAGTGSWAHPTVVTANTGTGNAEYTLPGSGEEMVWKGGAIQIRGTDYTRTGNDITFNSGNIPAAGEDVTVAVAQNNLTSTDALTLNGVADDVNATASTIVKRGTDSTIKASNHASIGSAGAAGTAVILDSGGKVPSAAIPSSGGSGFAMALLFGGY